MLDLQPIKIASAPAMMAAMVAEIERLRGQLAFVACYITDMSIRGESATAWRAIEEEHGEREDSYAVAGAWLNTMRQPPFNVEETPNMTDTCGGCGDARHRLDLCAGCVQGLRDERDTARAEVEALRALWGPVDRAMADLTRERDEARAEVERLRAGQGEPYWRTTAEEPEV